MKIPAKVKPWMLWAAALATGLMLSAAWPAGGFTPLVFLAFVPLLWVEDYVQRHKKDIGRSRFYVFGYALTAFLTWNILTTYWVWNSTPAAALAWITNALIMSSVFYLYHFTSAALPAKGAKGVILILYWVAFEYIHHQWDIAWPWLTLGNVFSPQPRWVQWYEITGTLGGSIWVLSANFLFLEWVKANFANATKRQKTIKALSVCLFILVPVFLSMWRYSHYESDGKSVETVVVQPNIDPYEEQYSISPVKAVKKMLFLAEYALTSETRFIVTPESMIQEYVWEHNLIYSSSVKYIEDFLKQYPNADVLAGISTYSVAKGADTNAGGVRKLVSNSSPTIHFKAHNTIVSISALEEEYENLQRTYDLRHKSKLTPGVEIMPLVDKIKFLENWAIDLGGIVGTLGIDSEPIVFYSIRNEDTICYADVICYESIFGEYVSGFARNGAELLFISTNDGWWKDSPGHRQHASYARLRAIENRRDIARSANTGISCFVNQRGDITDATEYWEPAVIKKILKANRQLTFYVRYGDLIGRTFVPISLLLLLGGIVWRIVKKKDKDEF